jgi:hypothetical protein
MRKYSKIIAAAIAVASLAVPTAAMANASGAAQQAGASYSAGPYESGWVGSSQPGGTVTTQYSSTYTDPVFGGPITCTGVHQVKKNGPVQDSFTCSLVKGANPAAQWNSVPQVGQTVGWNSDYYAIMHPGSLENGSMTITSVGRDATGNVTSYTGLATYPGATS